MKNKNWIWILILILVVLNFFLQSFDFLIARNNPFGFYYFNSIQMNWFSFVVNKAIRLSLNITVIWIIQWYFFTGQSKIVVLLIVGLILLGVLDVFVLQTSSFISFRIHEFLHPIVFSPLLAMVMLGLEIAGIEKTK